MQPKGERLEPLGASDNKNEENFINKNNCNKCIYLEDEKELLHSSLFSLITHFAQVQFRLRQVVNAPIEDQEELLQSLEEFACIDINLSKNNNTNEDDLMDTVKKRRNDQKLLLGKLKNQLKELKNFDIQAKRMEMTWIELLKHLHMKEDLEKQLKTQIDDLERLIEYLRRVNTKCIYKPTEKPFKTFLIEIIQQSFSFFQMFALFQFSWGSNCFTISTRLNHWGDLRAKLELAVIDLKKLLHSKEDSKKILLLVRKCLATNLRDLMQHGTRTRGLALNICQKSSTTHCWDIILYYYHFKKGDDIISSPIQKLSQSYNLEIANVSPNNNKKNLFCVIKSIISTHSRYRRSQDSHFKAFVCAALNARRLVTWLNLIFQNGDVIKTFYYPWSYVASTRHQDGLRSLDVLKRYKFDLPVDLDVQKFQIEDVFI